jgi:glycosyltransferase involved in cell wall biosynthesis
MRFLIVTHNLQVNGSNRFASLLSKGICMHDKESMFEVSTAKLFFSDSSADNITMPAASLWHNKVNRRLSSATHEVIRRDKSYYDVIILNSLICSEVGLFLADLDIRYNIVVHEPWYCDPKDEGSMPEYWGWDIAIGSISRCLKEASRVFFPSKVTEDKFVKSFGLSKSMTIRNPIEYLAITPTIATKIDTRIKLLQVGSINQRKNQKTTLRALKRVRDETMHDIYLTFIGARSIRESERIYQSQLKELRGRLNLENIVEILPVVSDDYKIYSGSQLLICPSTSEVTPYVILEALSYGIPVIATNTDGIPDIIPDCSLCRLLSDPHDDVELAQHISFVLDNYDAGYEEFMVAAQVLLNEHDTKIVSSLYLVNLCRTS